MAEEKKVLTLKDDGPPEPPPPDPPKSIFERLKFLVYFGGAGVVFLLVFVCGYGATYLLTPEPEPIVPGGTIAVLPFTTGSPDVDHLSDSFQSSLIEGLKGYELLKVTAEDKVDALAGDTRKLDAIGKELGVRYVLEGKVSKSGDQVVLNATMIDAELGASVFQETYSRSDVVPWSAADGALKDVLKHTHIELAEDEKPGVKRTYANEQYAERLAFGSYYCAQPSTADAAGAARMQAAIASFGEAAAFVESDKTLAGSAYVKQTECVLSLVEKGSFPEAEGNTLAGESLTKALEADEQLRTMERIATLAEKAGIKL